ncbi:hypothetical protein EDF56_106366 [Novosphingobium sp. PhB165]|uniref:hypothetical protein n=1 Tax=Novosphingobium sp. PhB165 TaxID=2485105 RepID=UPI0010540101|nr:hypothetical protein [Novosphingobium sp. PhB165]TCM17250.1 hypothetical protein EDF56_106366 [Novosphingobium sp. PhB165]
MSYEHLGDRLIRAVRKPHKCESCGVIIQPRQAATYASSVQDGSFYGWYSHPECREAEAAWNKLRGDWGKAFGCSEDYCWLFEAMDGEPIEQAWLVASHPAAAGRLGISLEGCERNRHDYWRFAV